jgi:general secretion pathway protein K
VSTERGLALILVLWALILLTTIGLSFGFAVRVETAMGVTLGEQVRAEAVAAAGVRRAAAGLLAEELAKANQPKQAEQGGSRWKMDGRIHQIPWPEATLRASVRAESAKIDLNLAPPELLMGLFANLLPESDAETLAAAVVQLRQPSASALPGAPAQGLGRTAPPPTSAKPTFTSVEALAGVPGFDANAVRRLRPYLTVHGGSAKVDAASADVEVIAAIPGVTRDTAERFVQERAEHSGDGERLDLSLLGTGAAYLDTGSTAKVANIRAAARLRDGASATVEAVLKIGNAGGAYEVLEWRDAWAGAVERGAMAQ